MATNAKTVAKSSSLTFKFTCIICSIFINNHPDDVKVLKSQ